MDASRTAQQPRPLTQLEAEERAALLKVLTYEIEVDLRGLLDGDLWRSTSTVRFECASPGAHTFVDAVGEIVSATLNGRDLDPGSAEAGRLPLPDLAATNELVVTLEQPDTGRGAGILRTVDPTDGLVYVWSSFEPDDARRAWACFDQPDLKAPHTFTVHAPASWSVVSNDAPTSVGDGPDPDARTWSFPPTPRLATYVVVIDAGPFHQLRRDVGGHDLGLWCRQSLRPYLERDAEDLFTWTAEGLAFFAEQFGQPFPQRRYDQVFVPDMGGAMENWGCVTWTDSVLFRSPPTATERQMVATVLLHEMAHMWFGDLVTMRWWDDLWLNEAFASWAATWAATHVTEFTDAWSSFLGARKQHAYQLDDSPASHPVRGRVPDAAAAFAAFDSITYAKGQAVLRQLQAYVGPEVFVTGLQTYFRDHAWGNTRLDDLIRAIGDAAGTDLTGWREAWLDRAGTDRLELSGDVLTGTSPDGGPCRPHRLDVGLYRRQGSRLRLDHTVPVQMSDGTARVPGAADADLVLLNDDDLTYASVRDGAGPQASLLAAAALLPSTAARAVAVGTARDLLLRGEAAPGSVLDCLLGVLAVEDSADAAAALLPVAAQVAERWSSAARLPDRRAAVAAAARDRLHQPDLADAALRTLAATGGPDDLAAVREHADAASDLDLLWRVAVAAAALGQDVDTEVTALLERDPDPDAVVRRIQVDGSRPDPASRDRAWQQIFGERAVPAGPPSQATGAAFWRRTGAPGQDQLLLGFAHRYLDEIERLDTTGLLAAGSLLRSMQPTTADEQWLARARALAADEQLHPAVRSGLLGTIDDLERLLRARAED